MLCGASPIVTILLVEVDGVIIATRNQYLQGVHEVPVASSVHITSVEWCISPPLWGATGHVSRPVCGRGARSHTRSLRPPPSLKGGTEHVSSLPNRCRCYHGHKSHQHTTHATETVTQTHHYTPRTECPISPLPPPPPLTSAH